MSEKVICALDVGTTGTRALLLNVRGEVVGSAYREVELRYPQPGWVEQDPLEIWVKTEGAMVEALAQAGLTGDAVCGIGVTNQRETTLLWERKSGQTVYPAIVWQDRRTESICQGLRADADQQFRDTTGLVIDPYFSASKLMWLLDRQPEWRVRAGAGELAFGTVDSWIAWNLTGGAAHVTDTSNASRTLLFDLRRQTWSDELLSRTGIPAALLPKVQATRSWFGETRGIRAVPDGIPVLALCGDQQASLFGQLLLDPGDWKGTYGTGGFLMAILGPEAVQTRDALTSIAWTAEGQTTYYLEAAVFVCGAALQWLRDGLELFRNYDELEPLLEKGRGWESDLFCVPAFTGLGTPFWDARARGLLAGLTRGTSRADLCKATLEGIAFEMEAAFAPLSRLVPCRRFVADGGATRSRRLMQFQADLLQTTVAVSSRQEGTGFGAGFLAGLECGFWSGIDELRALMPESCDYHPHIAPEQAQRLTARWGQAAQRSLQWAQE